MAEVSKSLGPFFFDVEPFESFDLGARFRRKGDHRSAVCLASFGGKPCSASRRSAEARRRSRMGRSGTVWADAIWALLRARLSSHSTGAAVQLAVFGMLQTYTSRKLYATCGCRASLQLIPLLSESFKPQSALDTEKIKSRQRHRVSKVTQARQADLLQKRNQKPANEQLASVSAQGS